MDLAYIFEQHTDGILVLNYNDDIVYVNALFRSFYKQQFKRQLDANKKLKLSDLKTLNKFKLNKQSFSIEGKRFQISADEHSIEEEIFYIFSCQDVSELFQHRLNNQLLEQDIQKSQHFKYAIDENPNPQFWIYKKTNLIQIECNDAFTNVLKYTANELSIKVNRKNKLMPLFRLVHPDDFPVFKELLRDINEGIEQKEDVELRFIDKYKREKWFNIRFKRFSNQGLMVCYLSNIDDIKDKNTILKLTSQQVKEKNKMLESQKRELSEKNEELSRRNIKVINITYYIAFVSFFLYTVSESMVKNEKIYALNEYARQQTLARIKETQSQYFYFNKYHKKLMELEERAFQDSAYQAEMVRLSQDLDSVNKIFEESQPNGFIWMVQKKIFGTGFFTAN